MTNTSALFQGISDDVRGVVRAHAAEALSNAGAISLTRKLQRRKFMKLLRSKPIAVSPFGYGEMCYRDFEIAIQGVVLAKPDVSHLVTFPNLLEAGETYLSLDWDPDQWVEEIEQSDIPSSLGERLHESFARSLSSDGINEFFDHVEKCWMSDEVCAPCRGLLVGYLPSGNAAR